MSCRFFCFLLLNFFYIHRIMVLRGHRFIFLNVFFPVIHVSHFVFLNFFLCIFYFGLFCFPYSDSVADTGCWIQNWTTQERRCNDHIIKKMQNKCKQNITAFSAKIKCFWYKSNTMHAIFSSVYLFFRLFFHFFCRL